MMIDAGLDLLLRQRASSPQTLARVLRKAGFRVNPVGDADNKTASPGTYRPVGRGQTCPACPYDGEGCYAQSGNVRIHAMNASSDLEPSVLSVAVAMVAAARSGRKARLHVSGDFATASGEVDVEYVKEVCILGRTVRELFGEDVVAWTYTHFRPEQFEPYRLELAKAGVMVRYSDHDGPNGAIVRDFATLRAGAGVAKCLAQTVDRTCASCRLCWERLDLTIAFDPHGKGTRKILKVLHERG